MSYIRNSLYRNGGWLLLMLLVLCAPVSGFAQAPNPLPFAPHGTCTTDPQFEIPEIGPANGMITVLVTSVQQILNAVSSALFNTIIGDSGFVKAVTALMTLYIAFYAIMFTVGMVQITLFDFIIRMVKIGIVTTLISPGAWTFFNEYVVKFFNAGTDDWINQISSVVLGVALPANAPPFYVMDVALTKAISAKMAVTIMAMFFTPPYGPIFALLVALGLGTFLRALLTAAWVYLMSLILKALLYGIAPIFLSFMLFARTRYLFDGWLNQLVNATLQPILLFTFLAFFVQLIGVALENLLITPVCWTEWAESVRGSPFSVHYWRFALCAIGGGDCQPYGGAWSFKGPLTAAGPIFPVDIVGVLVLVMLADLCSRFNSIVILIASDLAGASTSLASMQGALGDWFKKANTQGRAPDGGAVPRVGGAAGGARVGPPGGGRVTIDSDTTEIRMGGAAGGARPGGADKP